MIIENPNLKVFGDELPLYGLMFYSGIVLAAAVALIISKRRRIEPFDMISSAIYCMIGAMIGSKLLFIAVSYKEIIRLQIPLINVIKGGFVFYGGLIGGILGIFIYSKKYKLSLSDFFDIYAAVLPLGHAVGRIGCFFAGCCYGIPHDGAFSCTYVSVVGETPVGVPLLPIQLIEAACLLVLFVVLLTLFFKTDKKGIVPTVYALSYAVIRFVLEFFRGDKERGFFGALSTSQLISVLIAIAACVYIIWKKKTKIIKAGQTA